MSLDPDEQEFASHIRNSVATGFAQGQELIQPKYEALFNKAGDDLQGKIVTAVNESIGAQLNSIKAGDVTAGNDAARLTQQKSSKMGFIILAVAGFIAYRYYKKGKIL